MPLNFKYICSYSCRSQPIPQFTKWLTQPKSFHIFHLYWTSTYYRLQSWLLMKCVIVKTNMFSADCPDKFLSKLQHVCVSHWQEEAELLVFITPEPLFHYFYCIWIMNALPRMKGGKSYLKSNFMYSTWNVYCRHWKNRAPSRSLLLDFCRGVHQRTVEVYIWHGPFHPTVILKPTSKCTIIAGITIL